MRALLFTMDSHLLDESLLQHCLNFYELTSHWLHYLLVAKYAIYISHTFYIKHLIFRRPNALAHVPEFIVDNMAKVLQFVARTRVDMAFSILGSPSVSIPPILVSVMIEFLGDKRIRNPHLRATIVRVLLWLVRPDLASGGQIAANLGQPDILDQSKNRKLLPALLQLYVDIERTGQAGKYNWTGCVTMTTLIQTKCR